jgi:LysM domain
MATRQRQLALVGVVIAAFWMTGCATPSPDAGPRDNPAVTLSGTIATGTLVSVQTSDAVSGTVAVTANPSNHALTITLTGLTGNLSDVSGAGLSAAVVKTGTNCTPYGLTFSAGSLSTSANQNFTLASDHSPGWENPSFLHTLILTGTPGSTDNCASDLVAYAPLTWVVGDPRPDIHVVDLGTRAGATGQVTEVGGKLGAYTVVTGDNLTSIAARFQLTLNDLFYLNPARAPSPLRTVTQIGEVLNLSKSNR